LPGSPEATVQQFRQQYGDQFGVLTDEQILGGEFVPPAILEGKTDRQKRGFQKRIDRLRRMGRHDEANRLAGHIAPTFQPGPTAEEARRQRELEGFEREQQAITGRADVAAQRSADAELMNDLQRGDLVLTDDAQKKIDAIDAGVLQQIAEGRLDDESVLELKEEAEKKKMRIRRTGTKVPDDPNRNTVYFDGQQFHRTPGEGRVAMQPDSTGRYVPIENPLAEAAEEQRKQDAAAAKKHNDTVAAKYDEIRKADLAPGVDNPLYPNDEARRVAAEEWVADNERVRSLAGADPAPGGGMIDHVRRAASVSATTGEQLAPVTPLVDPASVPATTGGLAPVTPRVDPSTVSTSTTQGVVDRVRAIAQGGGPKAEAAKKWLKEKGY
jgi:hypothetical protein